MIFEPKLFEFPTDLHRFGFRCCSWVLGGKFFEFHLDLFGDSILILQDSSILILLLILGLKSGNKPWFFFLLLNRFRTFEFFTFSSSSPLVRILRSRLQRATSGGVLMFELQAQGFDDEDSLWISENRLKFHQICVYFASVCLCELDSVLNSKNLYEFCTNWCWNCSGLG